MELNIQSSTTQTIDLSSVADESSSADSLTTDQLLTQIEYNTRMTSQGVAHIFTTAIVLLGAMAVWVIIHKWFFGGV